MKKRDEFEIFFDAIVRGNPRAIEDQEARGQQDLIKASKNSRISQLPIKMGYGTTREDFEAMGIVFENPADDLFVYAALPEGWKIEATDHSMWSKLVDDQERERGTIFYKAAFYDRDAHINMTKRFHISVAPVGGYANLDELNYECVVTKDGETIWTSEALTFPASRAEFELWSSLTKQLYQSGENWLNENYPNWNDSKLSWNY